YDENNQDPATGDFTFSGNPKQNSWIAINGTYLVFTTGTPTEFQIAIGATLILTLGNITSYLMSSTDANLMVCSFSSDGQSILYVEAVDCGDVGNYYPLASST